MDRYRWYRPIHFVSFSSMLSIHRLKIFNFWPVVSTIDHKSLLWPMASDPSVHTEFIVSIHQSNIQLKKFTEFLLFFAMAMKKDQLLRKKTMVKSVKIATTSKGRLNLINNRRIDTDSIEWYYWSCFTLSIDWYYRSCCSLMVSIHG